MRTISFFLSILATAALIICLLNVSGIAVAQTTATDTNAVASAQPVVSDVIAAAGDLAVYLDGIQTPWRDNSWSAAVTYASTEQAYAGVNAVKVVQNAWGGLSMHIGTWGSAPYVDPAAYPRFEFAIYGGTTGLSISVKMENDLAATFPTLNYGSIPANQWVIVALAMSQLDPTNQPIDRINIMETSGAVKTYFVDNIRFVGSTQISVPAPPTTLSPSNGATGVSLTPVLGWNAASGASSYRVQLSTSATFATLVTDQSGLTGTSLATGGLVNGTVYVWRVNATNAVGTSTWSAVAGFTTATLLLPPSAPVQSAPANGALGVSLTPTISWNAVAGAVSYRLQISSNPGFTSAVSDQSGIAGLSSSVSGLANSTLYYLRMSATNAGGEGPWSTVSSFTTVAAAIATTDLPVYLDGIQSPWRDNSWNAAVTYASIERAYSGANAIKVVQNAWGGLSLHIGAWGAAVNVDPTAYPTVEFAVFGGTTGLLIYVSLENDVAASFPLVKYGTIPANQWVLVDIPMSQLDPNNQPIDRLNILEMSGAVRTYFVDDIRFKGSGLPPAIPAPPTAISPSNGATNVGIPPVLQWSASAGAASYRAQVSNAAAFATTLADQAGLTSQSFTAGGALNNAVYYWRVNATNASGTSAWSSVASFTTAAALQPPLAPLTAVPANGATGVSTAPVLNWNAVSGAGSYRVQVSTGATFAATTVDQAGLTSPSLTAGGLVAATAYYWRVNATNTAGTGNWSATSSFTTGAPPPPPAAGSLFVTAYYPDFGVCSIPPSVLDYTALTHIIYFHTDVDPNVAPYFLPVVSAAESTRIEWSNSNQGCARSSGESYQAELIRRAHAAGVKVLLCVGGIYGAGADRMALVASDSTKTQVWANSMAAYLIRKGFDGIDLDWEFPRVQGDYMRMLRIVRRKFDAMPSRGIFVAAVYGDANSSAYDYPNLKYYLDQVNIMTYDMWNNQNTVWLNSPLGKAAGSPSAWRTWRVSSALSWAAKGVPKSILSNGIPFYSWKFSNATALGQPLSGYTYATYSDAVNALKAGGAYHWDDSAKAPYVTYTSGGVNYLITYDDSNSVKYKVQRTKDDGIGGIMIYELWSGWLASNPAGGRDPLLQAVKRAVGALASVPAAAQSSGSTQEAPVGDPHSATGVPATFGLNPNFPNPFNPTTTITYQLPVSASVTIKIYDMLGREIVSLVDGVMDAGNHATVWDSRNAAGESVASGVYIYRMTATPLDASAAQGFSSTRKLMLMK